jgi:opacity protein-like surface antigen
MRNLIMIAAIAAVLFGSAAARAQSSQQASTEAGVDYAQSHAAYGYHGAYARYGGGYRHYRHYRW